MFFELVLLLKLNKQLPVEQFGTTVSQSTVPPHSYRHRLSRGLLDELGQPPRPRLWCPLLGGCLRLNHMWQAWLDSLRGPSVEIGTIQRKLAWPLRARMTRTLCGKLGGCQCKSSMNTKSYHAAQLLIPAGRLLLARVVNICFNPDATYTEDIMQA